ncbi:hypothetical protein COCSADRAFT_339915 [Bipolaris sorokiniana ND90Pr]|uniref:Uncharacterized protein n=1 Tax=Cochliobolus sativus (strain ND90Pr / ATCC 201652) TaxID=665912 RepID=M2S7W6_COCSN|nr:uncharacterized protein COCSADRAFT_339915 [Bipolaris sorokiniana ND90Pr]EMD63298.1 hypothetical protein COCSADRAFT_339915 [Bipolaris sorokiniana ND90Pr]
MSKPIPSTCLAQKTVPALSSKQKHIHTHIHTYTHLHIHPSTLPDHAPALSPHQVLALCPPGPAPASHAAPAPPTLLHLLHCSSWAHVQ